MTKLTRFLVILAVVGLSGGTALGQATKTVLYTARYEIGRDNCPDMWGIPGPPENNVNNWSRNQGGGSQLRIKTFEYVYHGDWDTVAMQADIAPGEPLVTGWGPYTPVYSLSVTPVADGSWPVAPVGVHISCVWSENDWVEGNGVQTNWDNYNWTPPLTYAATYTYAQDIEGMAGAEWPWAFPGGGVGLNAPYPLNPDCSFLGTFLTNGDVRDVYPLISANMESKTLTNSTDIIGSLADGGSYVTVDLDQAIIDDMLQNTDNRGLALYNLTDGNNKNIYSDNQNQTQWPYIQARIEVCSGDGNLDQAIDGLDYVIWSNNYQTGTTWGTGDWNQDLFTDGLDYVVWSNNYQQACPDVPGAVPEPATLALLGIGALGLMRRRRR